jgi:hypothetical protein
MGSATTRVVLSLTVHQPDERLADQVQAQLPALARRYAALVAYCSRETHPTILGLLEQQGVPVTVNRARSAGIHHIGVVRRDTIRAGLQADASHLQLCDFDRAIHWVTHYAQELAAVAAEIPAYDLLVLGRTPRAWATHPPYQAETEPLFNKVFALATGLPWDIGAGSRGLSRRAAETLLRISQEETVGVDAEWPLLLRVRDTFRVGYRPCEGLEYETADRYQADIEAAGDYRTWERQMSSDPQQWTFRLEVALLIAKAVLRYGSGGR